MPKYKNRETFINDLDLYEDHFEDRGIEKIKQVNRVIFNKETLKKRYSIIKHTWSKGDKLYKLAHKYYGRKDYWWIISLWNGLPTESHYFYGNVIQIPFPVEALMREITNG